MRLETTFAMYGGLWSDEALDALDGTNKRVGNKTYHFDKKDGHIMVSLNMNKSTYTERALGKFLDFGIDVIMDENQTSVLSVSKFNTVRVTSTCAEEGAIALREVV